MKTKIALIELGSFHDECLYSQALFLGKKEIEVTLFCNKKLKQRLKHCESIIEIVYLDLDSKLKKYKAILKIWNSIRNQGFQKVVFNTAESNIYKLIRLPFPKSVELIGILHNAYKLKNRKKQRTIDKRIHKYFTLNDFVSSTLKDENLTTNKISSIYTIFYPEFKKRIRKPKNEIWITIPGVIALDKRDYYSLIDIHLPKNVKLILLGRSDNSKGDEFLNRLNTFDSYDNIIIFDSFIDNDLFFDYIKNSDFILPLIHPNNESFPQFLKYKISGSYNLAFGFKIPLLMESSFSYIEDFKNNAIFYKHQELNNLLNSLVLTQKEMYNDEKWDFEYQQRNYLNFIFNQ